MAAMECTPHHNHGRYAYASIGVLFPAVRAISRPRRMLSTRSRNRLSSGAFAAEANYRSSPSPFGIKMVDRLRGIPPHLDISDPACR
ncbi:MAG: hypothetical protein ACLR8Y_16255 [Alistipes indistinctus]